MESATKQTDVDTETLAAPRFEVWYQRRLTNAWSYHCNRATEESAIETADRLGKSPAIARTVIVRQNRTIIRDVEGKL